MSFDYYVIKQDFNNAIFNCPPKQQSATKYSLRHPVLTRKSRSRRQSEYNILEKSRSPHDNFLKNKESFFPIVQK